MRSILAQNQFGKPELRTNQHRIEWAAYAILPRCAEHLVSRPTPQASSSCWGSWHWIGPGPAADLNKLRKIVKSHETFEMTCMGRTANQTQIFTYVWQSKHDKTWYWYVLICTDAMVIKFRSIALQGPLSLHKAPSFDHCSLRSNKTLKRHIGNFGMMMNDAWWVSGPSCTYILHISDANAFHQTLLKWAARPCNPNYHAPHSWLLAALCPAQQEWVWN